eukprot:5951874-Lingulodinium_polyedra.AAC.1
MPRLASQPAAPPFWLSAPMVWGVRREAPVRPLREAQGVAGVRPERERAGGREEAPRRSPAVRGGLRERREVDA